MAGELEQIRDRVKTIVESLYPTIPVYKNRFVDKNQNKYFNVVFMEGDINPSMDGEIYQVNAILIVNYVESGLTPDSDIEIVLDNVLTGIKDNYSYNDYPLIPKGFKHADRDDEFVGMMVMYNCLFRRT